MRLANLREFKFSDLTFYHYFFTAYIGLHVAFSLLLGNITAFAPDENTYVSLFNNFYNSNFKLSPTMPAYGKESPQLLVIQIIYLPAKLISFLGINSLEAIRLQSIFYSAVAILFVVGIAQKRNRSNLLFKSILIVYALIPTNFLWTSLALKESIIFASIAGVFYSIDNIFENGRLKFYCIFLAAIYSLSAVKSYIYVVLVLSIFFGLIFLKTMKLVGFKVFLAVILISLIPIIANQALAKNLVESGNSQLVASVTEIPIESNGSIKSGGFDADGMPNPRGKFSKDGTVFYPSTVMVESRGSTIHSLAADLKVSRNSIFARLCNSLGLTAKINKAADQSVTALGSPQQIENSSKLELTRAHITSFNMLIKAILNFIFKPLLFVDNGSLFLNLQSLEMPFWACFYFIFLWILVLFIKKRRNSSKGLIIPSIFIFGFILISAQIEINVGTALRHRSLLLIPILVILASRQKKPATL